MGKDKNKKKDSSRQYHEYAAKNPYNPGANPQPKKPEKLTLVEIREQMKILVAKIDRELFISNPYYHYITASQMNALRCGKPDWRLYGGSR